jgi:hypothetical protein
VVHERWEPVGWSAGINTQKHLVMLTCGRVPYDEAIVLGRECDAGNGEIVVCLCLSRGLGPGIGVGIGVVVVVGKGHIVLHNNRLAVDGMVLV